MKEKPETLLNMMPQTSQNTTIDFSQGSKIKKPVSKFQTLGIEYVLG